MCQWIVKIYVPLVTICHKKERPYCDILNPLPQVSLAFAIIINDFGSMFNDISFIFATSFLETTHNNIIFFSRVYIPLAYIAVLPLPYFSPILFAISLYLFETINIIFVKFIPSNTISIIFPIKYIVIADNTQKDEIGLDLGDNIRHPQNMVFASFYVKPNSSATKKIKFNNAYDNGLKAQKLIFGSIRILNEYDTMVGTTQENLDSAVKLYGMKINLNKK